MNARSKILGLLLLTLAAVGWAREPEKMIRRNPDWERGRAAYMANCAACHNSDPSMDGTIGPALKGSSRALLDYRVLRPEYPPGYRPKRNTRIMPAFPSLKAEVPYLAEYLR